MQANSACSSTTLQNGLEHTQIRIVDHLSDPNTHQPLDDKNLDAWTIPGDMQLLLSSWSRFFDPQGYVTSGRGVNTLVLHEVYRTTGTCNDDNFRLSEKVMHLLEGSGTSRFSEAFAFKYGYITDNRDETNTESWGMESPTASSPADMLCDKPIPHTAQALKGMIFNCIGVEGTLYEKMQISKVNMDDGSLRWWVDSVGQFKTIPNFGGDDLANQWLDVSPSHPFVVMHDITNGNWTWGMQ